jgi:hypothetical protein
MLPPGKNRTIAPLDETIVTAVRAGDRGGVQLRVAPARQLETAKSQLLFDDFTNDGAVQAAPWMSDFELLPIGATAAMVVVTPKGSWLVRVDKDGGLTPIDVVVQ